MGKMKYESIIAAVVFGVAASSAGVACAQQPQQTTQGAQKFLSQLVGGAGAAKVALGFEDSGMRWRFNSIRYNHYAYAYVTGVDGVDGCITRISSLDMGKFESVDTLSPSPSVALRPPHDIDWRRAAVTRTKFNGADSINIDAPSSKYKKLTLIFSTPDPEMMDRIEFAARFLKMSCDATTETGF